MISVFSWLNRFFYLQPKESVSVNSLALKKNIDLSTYVRSFFESVRSSEIISLNGVFNRSDFLQEFKRESSSLEPVIISQSEFVPSSMTAHLMRSKKDSALGVKYRNGDAITDMEAALHTFVTPICPIAMVGDYVYRNGHSIVLLGKSMFSFFFGKNYARKVILSAAIQPDFERSGKDEVVMKLVEVKKDAVKGEELLLEVSKNENLQKYEDSLQKYMVYHLMKNHELPALHKIEKNIMSFHEATQFLEESIVSEEAISLEKKFVRINHHVISLEALFNIYVHQLRNEFSVFEKVLPQGYVYTIDPPSIFARDIGGEKNVTLLNRVQILAFKQLKKNSSFKNLKTIGFNDYLDKGAIVFFKSIFPEKKVVSKQSLFNKSGLYSEKDSCALIVHNNSDAFGQNIETEGPTSMDGVIGTYSNAACQLQRTRKDLLDSIV